MDFPIDLDRQACLQTSEVEYKLPKRMLAPEFVAAGPFAKFAPDENFRQVTGLALTLCDTKGGRAGGEHPSTIPACAGAVPLPVPGRCLNGAGH